MGVYGSCIRCGCAREECECDGDERPETVRKVRLFSSSPERLLEELSTDVFEELDVQFGR